MLYESIKKLVQYGIDTGITPESERIYTTNLLLDVMKEDDYEDVDCDLDHIVLEDVLADLLDEAVKRGIIEDSITYRDLFDTRLMNCLMPRPAQIQEKFWKEYEKSPEAATAYYYKLSQDSDYIRRYRIKKDRKWTVETQYGTLQAGEGSEGYRCCRESKIRLLSKMSALYGKRGICRTDKPSRKRKPQDHPDHDPGQEMGLPVFPVCLLQRALYRI